MRFHCRERRSKSPTLNLSKNQFLPIPDGPFRPVEECVFSLPCLRACMTSDLMILRYFCRDLLQEEGTIIRFVTDHSTQHGKGL